MDRSRRSRVGAVLGGLLALRLVNGCEKSSTTTEVTLPTPVEAQRAADRLARLLPAALGEFAASEPATTTVYAPEATIRAAREYENVGRRLSVTLETGNIRGALGILASDAEHAFGSDSNTYWRTLTVQGRRARLAKNRGPSHSSTVYVRISDFGIAHLVVAPATQSEEAAELAAHLDCDAIGAAELEVGLPESPHRR